MNDALRDLLRTHNGVLRRVEVPADLAGAVRWSLSCGELRRAYPRTFTDAQRIEDADLTRRAAVAYINGPVALSHVSALSIWQLPVPGELPMHLTVPASSRPRCTDGLVVHRDAAFSAGPPEVLLRRGLPVVRLERALVQSWALLDDTAAREALITAVQEGRTTPPRVYDEAVADTNFRGRAQLLALLGQLRAGCRSQLEIWGYVIWGYVKVFQHPELPASEGQVPVELPTGRVYLDRYFRRERVNVELDGAAWHRSHEQRERDLRRDAALARLGILVVRISHRRLMTEPEAVRRELLAILAARREQLGVR